MEERAIRTICVVGGGIVALSAALAFARALPRVRVSMLQVGDDPAALADRLTGTLPSTHRFHAFIGFNELDLVRSGAAVHLLGTRFERWSADGEPWIHIFGEYGMAAGEAAFHQLWLRARQAKRALPFHRYAAAAAFAEAGKFAHPSGDPKSPLGGFLYALRIDPSLYRARLEQAASGLQRSAGAVAKVERRPDGGIAALGLADGRRIAADLYVDCTGPSAALLGALDSRFEDWSPWLPCDRVAVAAGPASSLTACDSVAARSSGWHGRSPLPGGTIEVTASCSQFEPQEAGEPVAVRAGRRPRPWIANVLAIGDAAVAVDPLHGTNLHLAQSAILRALELLPGRDCHPLELAEYNRRSEQEVVRVRDFLALHYLRSGRRDTPFWRAMADREPPESLALTLEQFERRGRLPFFEEESFDRHSWLAVLLGLGIVPKLPEAVALGVDLDRAVAAMDALAGRLAGLPGRFPSYPELLARMKAAPGR